MKRVLLLLPTTGYRNNDFLAAAKKLGVEIVAVANYCHQLAPSCPGGHLKLPHLWPGQTPPPPGRGTR